MTTPQRQTWRGRSGREYEFEVYPPDTRWSDTPGVYIFARYSAPDRSWYALYIGETESFQDRLTESHEKLPCARRNGMTHIHVHQNYGGVTVRRAIEEDLIARWNPPCNG